MDPLLIAEHIRDACLEAAIAAYEDAGIRGLCGEGRWEAALGAIQTLDVQAVVRELRERMDAAEAQG